MAHVGELRLLCLPFCFFVCVTETFLRDAMPSAVVSIGGYNMIR
jgi:hypothetical protein